MLVDLSGNVNNLAHTAFTKMLNNALEHSNGQRVIMGIHVQGGHDFVDEVFRVFATAPHIRHKTMGMSPKWPSWSACLAVTGHNYLLAAAKAAPTILTMLGCNVPSFGFWPCGAWGGTEK